MGNPESTSQQVSSVDQGVLPAPPFTVPYVAPPPVQPEMVPQPSPVNIPGALPTPPFTPPNPKTGIQSVAPKTTVAEDEVLAGQRQISFIWEISQAAIALIITLAVVYTAITHIVSQELTNAFFLIVGFYFSRTNHQAIGGIGLKKNESQEYQGR